MIDAPTPKQIDPLMFSCAFCHHAVHSTGCKDTECDCTQGLLTGIIPALTMPVVAVGWLAFHALNHLPNNADDDEHLGLLDVDGVRKWCCRFCCGACLGLFQLREMGLLDFLLASTGKAHKWSWWDADLQTVKAGYLDNIAVRCEQCVDDVAED